MLNKHQKKRKNFLSFFYFSLRFIVVFIIKIIFTVIRIVYKSFCYLFFKEKSKKEIIALKKEDYFDYEKKYFCKINDAMRRMEDIEHLLIQNKNIFKKTIRKKLIKSKKSEKNNNSKNFTEEKKILPKSETPIEKEKNNKINFNNQIDILLSYKTIFHFNVKLVSKNEPIFIFDLFNSLYPIFSYSSEEYRNNIINYLVKRKVDKNIAVSICHDQLKEYGEISFIKYILNSEYEFCPIEFFEEVELKTFSKLEPKIKKETKDILSAIKYKKYIFSNGDLKIIKNILFSLGINDLFDGIFYLDASDKTIPTKKSMLPFELVDLILQNKNVFYFDSSEENIKLARSRNWNVYFTSEKNIVCRLNSVLNYIEVKNLSSYKED